MQIIYIEFSDHLRVDPCCSSEREIFRVIIIISSALKRRNSVPGVFYCCYNRCRTKLGIVFLKQAKSPLKEIYFSIYETFTGVHVTNAMHSNEHHAITDAGF